MNPDLLEGLMAMRKNLFQEEKKDQFFRDLPQVYNDFAWRRNHISPDALLEVARAPHSPIHSYFEWNDSLAAANETTFIATELLISRILDVDEHCDPVQSYECEEIVQDVEATIMKNDELKRLVVFPDRQMAELWRKEKARALLGEVPGSLLQTYMNFMTKDVRNRMGIVTASRRRIVTVSELHGLESRMIKMEPIPDVLHAIMRRIFWETVKDFAQLNQHYFVSRYCSQCGNSLDSDVAHEKQTGLCFICQVMAARFLSSKDFQTLVLFNQFLNHITGLMFINDDSLGSSFQDVSDIMLKKLQNSCFVYLVS